MRAGNLTSGAAKIREAIDQLESAWKDSQQYWNDANSRHLADDYLIPMTPKIKAALDAVSRMDEVLLRMKIDLNDDRPR
jgi:hypothetical protein